MTDLIIKQWFILEQLQIINQTYISKMTDKNYDYLSKSSVGSPLAFKKSPSKYAYAEAKTTDFDYGLSSSVNYAKKQWEIPQYNNVRKVSDDISSLRQTFDARTHSKLQEQLAKYDFEKQDSRPSNKLDNMLRQTFQTKVSSPGKDLSSSTSYEYAYRKEDIPSSYMNQIKSPASQKRSKNSQIDEKFKKYVDTSEQVKDFKQQLELTNKMNEELKRLKQDRKKRLEQKQKQLNELEKRLNGTATTNKDQDTFKRKNYYEYYTPKQPKSTYQDRFNVDKLSKTALDLSKYKVSEEPQSATVRNQKLDLTSSTVKQPKTPAVRRTNNTRENQNYSMERPKMKISDFALGKNLGQGKFGVVYQAIHKPSGFLVALKKVPKQMIKSHLMIDQFILELKLQTFLNHENILSLFNHFEDRTSIYLVLEYMEQGTLFTHLKKNKTLGEKQVAKKIRQIASAIQYLHENNIGHRDIKPENIVMSHGICKLCDFGWATVCDDRRKTYCGTFDYAPPQILEGVQYDQTVDLWCLGVLAYELLVGKAPFYHISRKQTMKRILNVQNTKIEYPQYLSKNAVSFIESLVKKDPKQRLSSDAVLLHPFLRDAMQDKV